MAKGKKEVGAEGTELFKIDKSPLGKAADKFIDLIVDIASMKNKMRESEEEVITEMEKAGRVTLLISHGGDNYFFEVKGSQKKLRCVKKNRQPVAREDD